MCFLRGREERQEREREEAREEREERREGRKGEGWEGREGRGKIKKEGGKKKEVSAKLNENVIIVINFCTDNVQINSDQLIVPKVDIIGV